MGCNMDIKIFCERLKKARKNKNLTQKELSSLSGVSAVMISAYENENAKTGKNPTLENVYLLAKQLGVSIDWLCGLSDNSGNEKKSVDATFDELMRSLKDLTKYGYFTVNNNDYYGIACCQFTKNFAYDFINECTKIIEVEKVGLLTDDMKANLYNGCYERYVNITDNDVRKFLDESYYKKMYEDNLPF